MGDKYYHPYIKVADWKSVSLLYMYSNRYKYYDMFINYNINY
jgi:hypothetical protein